MGTGVRTFVFAALASVSLGASAGPIVYTDRAAFNQAANPNVLIDFEQFAGVLCPPPDSTTTDPCVFAVDGATFVATQQPRFNVRPQLGVESGAGVGIAKGLISHAIPIAPGDFYFSF